MGAGLAEPEAVFLVTELLLALLLEVVVVVTVVTDNLPGRGVEVVGPADGFLCGIRDGVVSSTRNTLNVYSTNPNTIKP